MYFSRHFVRTFRITSKTSQQHFAVPRNVIVLQNLFRKIRKAEAKTNCTSNLLHSVMRSITVAHKCNGETKSHGKTNFNSRHNKINLQSNETSRQNKINSRQDKINSQQNNINSWQNKISSRQNTINSQQNKISSRQNTINLRQNKNQLTAKCKLIHGKIQSTHGKT